MLPKVVVLGLVCHLLFLARVSEMRAVAAPRQASPATVTPTHLANDDRTVIATVRPIRQIAMFYKLDLARDNALSKAMAGVMRLNEHRIRECYVDRLEARPKLRGRLALSFQLSKATGTMQQIAHAGGNIADPRLLRCVKQQLALLPFNPPRNLQGTLHYTFGVIGPSQGGRGGMSR